MSFQAYLDNIKARTGKTPEDFASLANERGLTTHGAIVAWLKAEEGLGHGHANAIAGVLLRSPAPAASPTQKLDALFADRKSAWRETCDALIAKVGAFGPDAAASPNRTYVNLLRAERKFAILQPSAADRLDIGIKLKDAAPTERFQAAGSWNSMVTHRVSITDPAQVDAEIVQWLRRAYGGAQAPTE